MANNTSMIGVIKNGQIVKTSLPITSHQQLASEAGVLVGPKQLAEGAEVFTVVKDISGQISVQGSQNFGGYMNISPGAQQIIKDKFQ